MDYSWIQNSLAIFKPELVLVAAIVSVILADLFKNLKGGPVVLFAALGLSVALASTMVQWWNPKPIDGFFDSYRVDQYSTYFKVAFLIAALLIAWVSAPIVREWKSGHGEFYTLLLSCTFGMCLMASANDLLMMYLALEFVSITSYIMAGMLRHNRKSSEASLKYIIYGAAASGVMIYGISFLYGATGTLHVPDLAVRFASMPQGTPPLFFLITSVLVMAGFAYKIAAVPFHMWCPDVYEGSPTPVTAFFSVGPKAAGFAMLGRFLLGAFGVDAALFPFEWILVIALLSVMTMVIGNFGAIHQQNLKRLFAYSSIAHAGYLLLAFTVFGSQDTNFVDPVSTLMFYIVTYVIMNLGAFLVVIILEQEYGVETVEGCRGLGWRAPFVGVMMAIFLFSLTGLPPTGGFLAKLYLLAALINKGDTLSYGLALTAVIFTVISLYYYMRVLAALFLGKPRTEGREPVTLRPATNLILLFLGLITLALGIFPQVILPYAQEAAAQFWIR